MNRIDKVFIGLRQRKQTGLIPYIMAGYPDIETTDRLIIEFDRIGADIIELGVPFSDPIADGPVIQAASEHALQNNISLRQIIAHVKNLRADIELPVVLMSYYNVIYAYGIDKFVNDATSAGIDGVIVPDLPPEEARILEEAAADMDMCCIFLLAPTSTLQRIKLVNEHSTGFIYYVSVTGTTGMREQLADTLKQHILQVRSVTTKPVGVGFGISTPEHVSQISLIADAAIVGSAIISRITKYIGSSELIEQVTQFVSELKLATIE